MVVLPPCPKLFLLDNRLPVLIKTGLSHGYFSVTVHSLPFMTPVRRCVMKIQFLPPPLNSEVRHLLSCLGRVAQRQRRAGAG